MTRIKMISADGGTEIEVNDDRVEHFERKGYTTAGAKLPRVVTNQRPLRPHFLHSTSIVPPIITE